MDFISNLNHYSFAIILTAITSFGLALFILLKEWNRAITRMFGLYTFTIGAWSIGWLLMAHANSRESALFWGRALHFAGAYVPTLFLHFSQILIGINKEKKQAWIRYFAYFISTGFVLISFYPAFVSNAGIKLAGLYYIGWGPLYPGFFLFFVLTVLITFTILIRNIRISEGEKKTQLTYILAAYSVGYMGGIGVFIPAWNIPVPKYALYSIPIAHCFLAYAIIKLKLLNVRVFIRRVALLAIIYGALVICTIPMLLFVNNNLINNRPLNLLILLEALFIGTVLSLGPFLYAYFIRKGSYFQEQAISGITHELKSPLAIIENALEFLRSASDLNKVEPSQLSDYLQMIQRNSSRLSLLVNDLLHTFKQGGAIQIAVKSVDLKELCQKIANQYQALAENNNLKLAINSTDQALVILCDEQMILQVLSNLISNAIKFSKNGHILIDLTTAANNIRISVTDSGCGIPNEELPYVFDRFFQGKQKVNRKGTGLGLSIAKTWVEAHGGKIWAESEGEGKGTKVTFSLPIQ